MIARLLAAGVAFVKMCELPGKMPVCALYVCMFGSSCVACWAVQIDETRLHQSTDGFSIFPAGFRRDGRGVDVVIFVLRFKDTAKPSSSSPS